MTDDTKIPPPDDDDLPPPVTQVFGMTGKSAKPPRKRPDINKQRKQPGGRTVKASRPASDNPLEGAGRKRQKRTTTESKVAGMRKVVDRINKHLSDIQREAAKVLSPPQIKFANNILNGLSNGPAWADAFPDNAKDMPMGRINQMGGQLIHKPEIQTYLQAFKSAAGVSALYDRKWKRETLVEIVERCMALSPVLRKGKDIEQLLAEAAKAKVPVVLETKFNPKGAISGLHELNMMDGDLFDGKPNDAAMSHEQRLQQLIDLEAEQAKERGAEPLFQKPAQPIPSQDPADPVH